jgi:hypothetical protein
MSKPMVLTKQKLLSMGCDVSTFHHSAINCRHTAIELASLMSRADGHSIATKKMPRGLFVFRWPDNHYQVCEMAHHKAEGGVE